MPAPRFPEGLWPSAATTQRIIDAVGKKHTPPDIDVSSLRTALYEYRGDILRRRLSTATYRSAHRKAARRVAKLASELHKLLKSTGNEQLNRELWFHLELDSAGAALAAIENVASVLAEHDANSDSGGINALAVERLMTVYRQHFRRDAGRSRNAYDGSLSGPFIRFVQAAGEAAGLSISKHTIDAVLRKRRGGQISKIVLTPE